MPGLDSESDWILCVMLYNLFAFAFQLPIGAFADIIKKNILISVAGCCFIILAYLTLFLPSCLAVSVITSVIAGIGNACFHVGGGIDVIHAGGGCASLPGVFVSTGALGIYLGGLVYKYGFGKAYAIPVAAVACLIITAAMMLHLYRFMQMPYKNTNVSIMQAMYKIYNNFYTPSKSVRDRFLTTKYEKKGAFVLICICLITTVCIRSYVGTVISYEWRSSFVPGLMFVIGIILGKALGGIIGDKTLWGAAGTVSLLISCVFLTLGNHSPIFGIIGIFAFNITMPLTLTSLANLMPFHTGLAFGITTFALFMGFIPSIFIDDVLLSNIKLIVALILFSTVLFMYGMYLCDIRLFKIQLVQALYAKLLTNIMSPETTDENND
jgi:FSR family fosmidomycin resistance protein-like MFS transporter